MTPTWNLGHPIIPPAAEELALGREIRGLVQCAVEDVDVFTSVGLEELCQYGCRRVLSS